MDKQKEFQDSLIQLSGGITKKDFVSSFKKILKIILDVEKKMVAKIDKAIDTSKQEHGALKNTTQADFRGLTAKHKELIDKALKEQENGLNFLRDKSRKIKDFTNGKDGKNADDKKIVEEVLKQIKMPEQEILTTEQIRDKIETLQGEERFDLSTIKGLRGILKKLEDRPLGVGGGFSFIHMSRHIRDDITPTGTVNNTNKIFTVDRTPNPTSSLKVFVNGMRMRVAEDYTLSGKTITFITAPPTGSVLICDFMI